MFGSKGKQSGSMGSGGGTNSQRRGGYYSTPKNDGNLFTSKEKIQNTDYFGNRKSARKPSMCYITTACVEARGLGDDCYELNLLRLFRQEYVAQLPDGERIIADYHEKAPRILIAIESLGPARAREVYLELYERGIAPSVERIVVGRWDDAYEIYRTMCEELDKRFLAAASPLEVADNDREREGA